MEQKNRQTQSDKQISELHEQALVIDSHNDAIVAHIRRGNVSLADESVRNPMEPHRYYRLSPRSRTAGRRSYRYPTQHPENAARWY